MVVLMVMYVLLGRVHDHDHGNDRVGGGDGGSCVDVQFDPLYDDLQTKIPLHRPRASSRHRHGLLLSLRHLPEDTHAAGA